MKKNELMNGDVVVLSSSSVAVVIGSGEDAYLMFQNSGFEFLDDYYNDNLICEDFDDSIMKVFRSNGGFGFDAINEESPIWERNDAWVRPTVEEHTPVQPQTDKREDLIDVIAQQFYGNCTYTSIRRDDVDFFLKGIISSELFCSEDVAVDRRIVRIPGFDNLAIVYDQIQEDRYVQVEFPALLAQKGEHYRQRWGEELPMQVSCKIPQLGFEIHTRCFACRIDEAGNFQSLRLEDSTPVIMCFAR